MTLRMRFFWDLVTFIYPRRLQVTVSSISVLIASFVHYQHLAQQESSRRAESSLATRATLACHKCNSKQLPCRF